MKKQNKIILSTFIAFSSIIAINSTSLADDFEYKDQISSVNEEYKESLENEPSKESSVNELLENKAENKEVNNTLKESNIAEDSNENLKNFEDESKEENNIVDKNNEDLSISEDLNDTNNKINEVNKNDNQLKPSVENKEENEDEDSIENSDKSKGENLEIDKAPASNFSFYSASTRSRSSNQANSYIIENNSAYKYSNGNKITVTNTWVNIGKDKYFANSTGKIVKGIQKIGLDRFYFANNGILKTNTKVVTNKGAYLIGESGIMNPIQNRWIKVNSNKYHTNSVGDLNKGYNLIENNIYSFDNNGRLEKNKLFKNKVSIIAIDNNGIVNKKRNTKTVIGNYEYTSDNNGNIISTKDLRKKPEVLTYYMQGGKAYKKYNNNTRALAKNEWIKLAGNDYRTNSAGQLLMGVHKLGNYYYNFTENGLAKDYKTFYAHNGYDGPGRLYSFDKSGKGVLLSSNYTPKKDLDVAIGWMLQGMNFNYKYDMSYPNRDRIGYADCSSAVYRAMKHGGFISKNTPNGNTETLFALGDRGRVLKEISENQIRYGDIFVAGRKGYSLGAGGHTGFILNKNTIIHCNWADRGISITPRKGRMGDNKYPVRYYRLVGGKSTKYNI